MTTHWTDDPEPGSGHLTLQGSLTIADVAEVRDQCLEAFARGTEQITLDISGLTAIDVAGVQLLCACHRFAAQHGQNMQLHTGDNGPFRTLTSQTGMARGTGCHPDRAEQCLWLSD